MGKKSRPSLPYGAMPEAYHEISPQNHPGGSPADLTITESEHQPARPMGKRRTARELALQILYAMEISGQNAQESFSRIMECFEHKQGDWEYTRQILFGVEKHREQIDRVIQQCSENWRLHRMACVDRNLLRLSVFELMFCPDIPKKVAINEAVELGKKYGSEDTGAFVNGVLDRVAAYLEK
jgi:N utilization substance protein B